MCLHPLTLGQRDDWYNSLKCEIDRLYSPAYYRRLYPDVRVVSCGKCVECVKKKQNDYLQVYYLAARRYKTMHFITLTYSDSTIPVSVREVLDYSDRSGECFKSLMDISDTPMNNCLAASYFLKHKPGTKYVPRIISYDGRLFQVCPTVRRRDVRLWLKRCRVNYEYKFGEKLPDFGYSFTPEFGNKTFRPHYHLLFFGLDQAKVDWMLRQWSDRFGYTYCEEISVSASNDSRCKVSSYVSKYINKGSFEPRELARDQSGSLNVESPRVCSSRGLLSLLEEEEAYYNLQDIACLPQFCYGIDPCLRLKSRQSIIIGKFRYSLGRHLIDYLYKNRFYHYELSTVYFVSESRPVYDEQGRVLALDYHCIPNSSKVKRSSDGCAIVEEIRTFSKTQTTSVYQEMQEYVQRVHDIRVREELAQLQRQFPDKTAAEIGEQFLHSNELALQARSEIAVKSLKQFYSKSKF